MLGVWTHLEGVFARHSGHNNRMQIARVQTPKKRLVGKYVVSQSVSQSTQSVSQSVSQSVIQSVSQSVSQSVTLLVIHSLNHSLAHSLGSVNYLCTSDCDIFPSPSPGILIPSPCVEDMKLTLNRVAEQAAGMGEEPGSLA